MSYLPDNRVKWIVVHYSATFEDQVVPASTIDRWHRERGFAEIGYHYYIRRDGRVEKGRDLTQAGRFEQGAHSEGENSASVGICYEGGLIRADGGKKGHDTRTLAQRNIMRELLIQLKDRFPAAKILGHRQMPAAATECPGFDAGAEYAEISAGRVPLAPTIPKACPTCGKPL